MTVFKARPKFNSDLTNLASGVHEEFDERLDPQTWTNASPE